MVARPFDELHGSASRRPGRFVDSGEQLYQIDKISGRVLAAPTAVVIVIDSPTMPVPERSHEQPVEAVRMLGQVGVHRTVPNLTPIPSGAVVTPSTAPDPLLSIPQGLQVSANGTVSVPVDLSEARPAGSTGLTEATLALRFDPSVFTVSAGDIHLGSIPEAAGGWTLTASVDAGTGQIRGQIRVQMPKEGANVKESAKNDQI